MLVFDVTNMESFENVQRWLQDVRTFGVEGAPLVLVGNKVDCVSRRVVAPEMGQQLAQRLGCRYVETSAKDSARTRHSITLSTSVWPSAPHR